MAMQTATVEKKMPYQLEFQETMALYQRLAQNITASSKPVDPHNAAEPIHSHKYAIELNDLIGIKTKTIPR